MRRLHTSTELTGKEIELLTRVAWLYYVEGLTQNKVARELGIHRLRVNRALARCRRDGIVRISIHSPYLGILELEEQLIKRFGLSQAMVIPSPVDVETTQDIVGAALGTFLNERLQPNLSLGVFSGRTLFGALNTLEPRSLPGLEVVSLAGGLTRHAAMLPYESAHRLAQLYDATCYYLPTPSHADSKRSRDEILSQALVREVLGRAAKVDIAIVGVGRLTPEGVISAFNLLNEKEIASLEKVGTVGAFISWFIDKEGGLAKHVLNERVVALPLDHLKKIPEVVLCGGGRSKARALKAVLVGGYAKVLITDETAAREILDEDRPLPKASTLEGE